MNSPLSQCKEPEIGALLADELGGDRGSLAPALKRHLRECSECKAMVERTRRIATVWRRLEPTGGEVAAARARFLARRAGRSRVRVTPMMLAFGVLLVAAAAFGGVRIASNLRAPVAAPGNVGGGPTAPPRAATGAHAFLAPLAPPHAAPVPAVSATTAERVVPAAAAEPVALAAVPSSAPASASLPRDLRSTTPHAQPPAARAAAPHAEPVAEPPIAPVTDGPAPPPRAETAPAPRPSEWAVAAEAMRVRDYATAERAFGDLATTSDAKTRDEARLSLAQVRLAEGRAGEARPELVDLAARGATLVVRKRAAEALIALDGSSRSPAAGTNSP